MIFAVSGN